VKAKTVSKPKATSQTAKKVTVKGKSTKQKQPLESADENQGDMGIDSDVSMRVPATSQRTVGMQVDSEDGEDDDFDENQVAQSKPKALKKGTSKNASETYQKVWSRSLNFTHVFTPSNSSLNWNMS